jgi:DNA-binding Lrp family transcriptional regulator
VSLKRVDYVDRVILAELIRNSRASLRSIASKLNLGISTVYMRVRKLLASGVIEGFTVDLDLGKLGLGAQALIEVKPRPQSLSRVVDDLLKHVEVIDLCEVSGDYPIVARVVATDDVALARAIERISSHSDIVDVRVRYVFQTRKVRTSERLAALVRAIG